MKVIEWTWLTLLVAFWRNLAESIFPDSFLSSSNLAGMDRLDDIVK